MSEVDSILVNQPVSREGVLPYPQHDGTVIHKFKRWEDLEANIGKTVPILDEHPSKNNGNDGLFSGNEKVWGYATLKACPKGEKVLCADLDFKDGAPIKNGYSPGYEYSRDITTGEYKGKVFDMIQAGMDIDHVALTDYMRDGKMLQVAGDATGFDSIIPGGVTIPVTSSNDTINNKLVGHDTFKFTTSKFALSPRLIEIREHLKSINPKIGMDELIERADKMLENEIKLKKQQDSTELLNMAEVLEKEKRIIRLEADNDSLGKAIEAKDKEIADLRLEIEKKDGQITDLDSKLVKVTKERDDFAEVVIEHQKEKHDKEMDSLFKQTDLDNNDLKTFDGEITPGSVQFAKFILSKLNLEKDTSKPYVGEDSKKPEPSYHKRAVYNPATGRHEWQ